MPYGIEFIFAIDWLVDRFRTMFNICGDTVVAALVASRLDEETAGEFLKKVEEVEEDLGENYDPNAPKDNKIFDMHGHANKASIMSA